MTWGRKTVTSGVMTRVRYLRLNRHTGSRARIQNLERKRLCVSVVGYF